MLIWCDLMSDVVSNDKILETTKTKSSGERCREYHIYYRFVGTCKPYRLHYFTRFAKQM